MSILPLPEPGAIMVLRVPAVAFDRADRTGVSPRLCEVGTIFTITASSPDRRNVLCAKRVEAGITYTLYCVPPEDWLRLFEPYIHEPAEVSLCD